MYQLVSIPRFTLLDAGALGLSGKMGYPAHVAPVLSPLTEMFWCVCVCACVRLDCHAVRAFTIRGCTLGYSDIRSILTCFCCDPRKTVS